MPLQHAIICFCWESMDFKEKIMSAHDSSYSVFLVTNDPLIAAYALMRNSEKESTVKDEKLG